MSLDSPQARRPLATTYERPELSDSAAFYGHYEPTRERVQMLLDYALAHEHDPFWRALAKRLSMPGCGSPWNEAIAAANEAGLVWSPTARIRRVVHMVLYEGKAPGWRRTPLP